MRTGSRYSAMVVALGVCAVLACENPTASSGRPSFATSAFLITGMRGTGGVGGGGVIAALEERPS